MSIRFSVWHLVMLGILTCLMSVADAQVQPEKSPRFGLDKRIPWTTSNVRGRPEPPPPYRPERLYSKLRFKGTTLLDVLPGTGHLLVGEQSGKIYLLPLDRNAEQAAVFLDCKQLVDQMNSAAKPAFALEALYGMAFDPDFAKNRYCYVCYVIRSTDGSSGQMADGTRVSRFQVTQTDPPACDIATEKLMLSWLQGGHNGGCLRFGLDGCLYISTGDGGFAFPPDGRKAGQDLSTLLSKILRIDVRKPDGDRPYTIPADNPFVNLAGARAETWAYGLRNPWKMSIDRKTGDLWVGDVGWELWELVYRVNKGDNFGWSIVEGKQPVHAEGQLGPTPIIPATMEIPHTDGASITGGFVYRGKQFPDLVGTYVFGDWETRRIWGAKVTEEGKLSEKHELIDPIVRIVDFAESTEGELYLLDHDDGSIFTLAVNEVHSDGHKFPQRLTDSGLFTNVARHQVAPGVLPFSVNAEQWSDGALAERFVAVPGNDPIRVAPRPRAIPGSMFSRATDFPLNSVLMKTLSADLVQGDPGSRRRIETQILHFDGREWQAYTYEWNDEQTDATLVDRAGKNRTLNVRSADGDGGQSSVTWRFAARAECIRCHNPWSEYTLGFNIPQLNRSHDFGGTIDNQIRTYRHIGLLTESSEQPDSIIAPNDMRPVESLPRLAPPFDEHENLNARARSYLHANCGHCHRNNGGGSSYIFLQHDLSLKDTKAIGTRPTQGTFGIHEAQVLVPGDPFRSILYFRLAKVGPGHMPHLGARQVDEQGLKLIHDWIRSLPPRLEDSILLDRLIELDEAVALRKEKAEQPATEQQIARAHAKRQKRDQPSDADLIEARRQVAEIHAKAAKQRAEERVRLTSELLSSSLRAVMLAEAFRSNRLSAESRDMVITSALSPTTDPAVRDLFESFVPENRRTKRLGETIDRAEILKLVGDPERGRQLFHESTVVQCRNCHRIGGKGTELGPDLDGIGKKYDRSRLLESILQPSLQIDPKYKAWLIETKSGQVLTGLIIRRDTKEIELRDAKNKLHRISADTVEEIFPQTKSLMPELLVRDFTAQQMIDLLEYLGSLKSPP